MSSSPRARLRIPSWISVDLTAEDHDTRTSPTSSSTPKQAATTSTPRSKKKAASPSRGTWPERKLPRTCPVVPFIPAGACATTSVESTLLTLCRRQDWPAALARAQEHAQEAEPCLILDPQAMTLDLAEVSLATCPQRTTMAMAPPQVYQDTALYLVCLTAQLQLQLHPSTNKHENENVNDSDGDKNMHVPVQLFNLLLTTCPKQAIISHNESGHTALRALVRNSTTTPEILDLLLQHMKKQSTLAAFQSLCTRTDRTGWRPLDHLLMALNHPVLYHSKPHTPLDLIKVFLHHVGGDALFGLLPVPSLSLKTQDNHAHQHLSPFRPPSPLIRLLSLNHAYSARGVNVPKKTQQDIDTPHTVDATNHPPPATSTTVLYQATHYLLHHFPALMNQESLTTSCTPLHVALRNHGNNVPLMQCFFLVLLVPNKAESTAASTRLVTSILACLRKENMYGDLPIHVACSVGTPVSVLRLVLEGTLQANDQSSSGITTCTKNKNLCWAVNHAGYTPIDLEWIRHMEDGKGFFMARSFYSLEAGGVKKTFWKQDEFYRVLLQQAVQQAMDAKAMASTTTTALPITPMSHPSSSPRRHYRMLANTNTRHVPAPASTTATVTPPRTQQVPAWHRQAASPGFSNTTTATATLPPQPTEQPTWELLLHRIFLIIQTAAMGKVPKTQIDLEHCLLHAACQLSFPVAPSLPLPLLELILFLYPEQLLLAQQTHNKSSENACTNHPELAQGSLPLHYAVQPQVPLVHPHYATTCTCSQHCDYHGQPATEMDEESSNESKQHICIEWEKWVKLLLEHGAHACSTTNGHGQLPLHKALEYGSVCPCCDTTKEINTRATTRDMPCNIDRSFGCVIPKATLTIRLSPQEKARLNVIRALVDSHPDSVDVMDPISGLMPFQMAAASPYMPLDAVFYLLRRSPDAVVA